MPPCGPTTPTSCSTCPGTPVVRGSAAPTSSRCNGRTAPALPPTPWRCPAPTTPLSDPARRALFDRHGLAPVRERSPGAAVPPTPWRIVKQQPLPHVQPPAPRIRRSWRAPATAIFCLGLVAGLAVAAYLQRQVSEASVDLPPQQQVVCDATPTGPGYMYVAAGSNPPSCTNGAVPRVLP